MIFQQMKPGTSLIPYFNVILTGKSISSTIFMTQGYLQGHPPPPCTAQAQYRKFRPFTRLYSSKV